MTKATSKPGLPLAFTLALATAMVLFDANASGRAELRRATHDGFTIDGLRCVCVIRDIGDIDGLMMQVEAGVNGPPSQVKTSQLWWPMSELRAARHDFRTLATIPVHVLHEG